jgi:hypothetical protein
LQIERHSSAANAAGFALVNPSFHRVNVIHAEFRRIRYELFGQGLPSYPANSAGL